MRGRALRRPLAPGRPSTAACLAAGGHDVTDRIRRGPGRSTASSLGAPPVFEPGLEGSHVARDRIGTTPIHGRCAQRGVRRGRRLGGVPTRRSTTNDQADVESIVTGTTGLVASYPGRRAR